MSKLGDKGQMQVMKNGHYFATGDTPIFWLGDTAWTIFQKLSKEEARVYFENRLEKGYNFIYCVLVKYTSESNYLPQGVSPESDTREYLKTESWSYWAHVLEVVQLAEEMGLYLGLLPVWGDEVRSERLQLDGLSDYMEFLETHFSKFKNLVWIVGGDNRGDQYTEIWDTMGQELRTRFPETVIGYHPFGRTSSSYWFHNSEWLGFNMFQSGHRRTDQRDLGAWDEIEIEEPWHGERSYRYVQNDYNLTPTKPVLDGEPSYEQLPQGLHSPAEPFWQDYHTRRYAYWAAFAGAAGHIYGHNAIIQFYDGVSKAGYGVKEVWQAAMHDVGSGQMGILKALMEELDFSNSKPMQDVLSVPVADVQEDDLLAFGKENLFACYSFSGKPISLKNLKGNYEIRWMDPVSGIKTYVGMIEAKGKLVLTPPAKKSTWNDWVLLLSK